MTEYRKFEILTDKIRDNNPDNDIYQMFATTLLDRYRYDEDAEPVLEELEIMYQDDITTLFENKDFNSIYKLYLTERYIKTITTGAEEI